jgi:hypothetical protein
MGEHDARTAVEYLRESEPDEAASLESPEYDARTVKAPGAVSVEHEPTPAMRGARHNAVPPELKATVPVGIPLPTMGATVAEKVYVSGPPTPTVAGSLETVVVVTPTSKAVAPEDAVSLELPEYRPVTVSVPSGALPDVHEPEPLARVATHNVVVPTLNVTVPVGERVPRAGTTVAEYLTCCPAGTDGWFTETSVVVAPTATTISPDDAVKLASPE